VNDVRAEVARYYDLLPEPPPDIPFYRSLVPSPEAQLLELGCGTGRVLIPLAASCGFIQGIDSSQAMLDICRDKLRQCGLPVTRAQAAIGDICDFDLGRRFDLIIAPYRVLQNLETDAQLDGLFGCLHAHLSPHGTCVLNVFRPKWQAPSLDREWLRAGETFNWEVPVEGGRVTCHDRRLHVDGKRRILYPELIWRRYRNDELVDEAVLRIAMRCYYPEEFATLIAGHGFRIVNRWGGYAGEAYGEGPELVVQFRQEKGI
jgi:SAM-dependent methyltransferase